MNWIARMFPLLLLLGGLSLLLPTCAGEASNTDTDSATETTTPAREIPQISPSEKPAVPNRVYRTRGEVFAVAQSAVRQGGRDLLIDIESVPGFLRASQIKLIADTEPMIDSITSGDKIAFRLLVGNNDYYVDSIVVLAPDTELKLQPAN